MQPLEQMIFTASTSAECLGLNPPKKRTDLKTCLGPPQYSSPLMLWIPSQELKYFQRFSFGWIFVFAFSSPSPSSVSLFTGWPLGITGAFSCGMAHLEWLTCAALLFGLSLVQPCRSFSFSFPHHHLKSFYDWRSPISGCSQADLALCWGGAFSFFKKKFECVRSKM